MLIGFPTIGSFLISLVSIVVMDVIWFRFLGGQIYPKMNNINIQYALIPWVFLAFAISCGKPVDFLESFIYGMFVGLIVFSVFNGTELCIREDWRKNWYISIVDICWGMLVCSATSLISYSTVRP
tara:strand:- start:392 stop:766 length:375 start_codon:yes stop_codon:yes gene_type:complete